MFRSLAALVLMAAAPAPASPSYGPFDGFGRGVHVFGGHVVDLGWGVEFEDLSIDGSHETSAAASRWSRQHVAVCSNADYICIRSIGPGGLVSLAAPRACPDDIKEGATWRVGDVKTVVLKRWQADWSQAGAVPPPDSGPALVFLLGDPARPDVIYRYLIGSGVTDLILARQSDSDVVAAAKAGELGDAKRFRVARLSTPDTFAACTFARGQAARR